MKARHHIGYVLRQMVRRFFSDGVSQSSAELAYFLLFSFFPLLMFLNSVLARVNISAQSLETITQMLPQSLQAIIANYMVYINAMSSLSPMIIGIVLTMFFLSRAMRSLMRTVNRVYRVEQRIGATYRAMLSILFTAGFLLAVVVSFVLVVAGRTLLRLATTWLPIPASVMDFTGSGYVIAIAFIFLFLMLFNRVVPNVRLRWGQILPGAIFSLVAWIGISFGFSFYVDNMANYSLLYGSIGAMMVLMLWLYLTAMVIILGTQLNHIILTMRCHNGKNGFIGGSAAPKYNTGLGRKDTNEGSGD